ncbi:MAG: nucleotidyltransferase domain-containing protein, partial [Bacteroidia bacterium]|nr:nucleotidyltransferase domain-containing protein [Bacteroidia bacterium]
ILPEILAKNLAEIHLLCRRHKVKRLWAFGSVLTKEFGPESDVDLLYELDEKQISDEEYLSNWDRFFASLFHLLGRKIDLIHYPSLKNPYFIEEIENTKVLLYVQKPEEILV